MLGEGRVGIIPDSVLALVQIRIFELPLRLRRVLLAASVFGSEFWSGGVEMLVAGQFPGALDLELAELEQAEFINRQEPSRYADELEYCLRNPVVREAAYGLLTEEERRTAHRRAASWMKKVGESDPMSLAVHSELGGMREAAAKYYLRAAEIALERNALEDTVRIAQRVQACGPSGQLRGALLSAESIANAWLWRIGDVMQTIPAALQQLPPDSPQVCPLLALQICGALMQGKMESAQAITRCLVETEPAPAERSSYVRYAAVALSATVTFCARDIADALYARIKQLAEQVGGLDVNVAASICHSGSDYVRAFQADLWQVWLLANEAVKGHLAAGDRALHVSALIRKGQSACEMGEVALGIRILRESVAQAERDHDLFSRGQALIHLAAALSALPNAQAWEEAERAAREVLVASNSSVGYKGWAHGVLARCWLQRGEVVQAEAEATAAIAKCKLVPLRRLWAQSLLAQSLIAQGRATAALADELLGEVTRHGCAGYVEVEARLTAAEVLHAAGEHGRAVRELRATVGQIRLRADAIPDPTWRAGYLSQVAENLRARALAQAWLRPIGEDDALELWAGTQTAVAP